MKPRGQAKVLSLSAPWEENLQTLIGTKFSRFPLAWRLPTRSPSAWST